MFKVGDFVKMNTSITIGYSWHSNESFIVVKIFDYDVVELDKDLLFTNFDSKRIHTSYLYLDIKETRKQKIKKLCLNQETK